MERRSYMSKGLELVASIGILLGADYSSYNKELENRMSARIEAPYCCTTKIPQKNMRISREGINLIKWFEGYREREYLDSAGKRTIGYGHLIRKSERFEKLTKEEAEKILLRDLEIAEKAIKENVKVELNQRQYDALISLVYNIGVNNFLKSTLLKKLNSGDYNGAGMEFKKWVYAGGKKIRGLEKRREKEKELFVK